MLRFTNLSMMRVCALWLSIGQFSRLSKFNNRGFGPCSEEGKMYNHDWYYTQPPEPESEEEHEEDIYWAERAAKEKREAQDD
jgi:hypothetical protein